MAMPGTSLAVSIVPLNLRGKNSLIVKYAFFTSKILATIVAAGGCISQNIRPLKCQKIQFDRSYNQCKASDVNRRVKNIYISIPYSLVLCFAPVSIWFGAAFFPVPTHRPLFHRAILSIAPSSQLPSYISCESFFNVIVVIWNSHDKQSKL
jgi:hypothetical protein